MSVWHDIENRVNDSTIEKTIDMKLLILDNFDSFTYNLVQLFQKLGADCLVFRNNVSFRQVVQVKPDAVVISPGPGTVEKPEDFGVCRKVIEEMMVPQLGVCLGHQGIGYAFGAKIIRTLPVHGKTSMIHHDGKRMFRGITNPFRAARYHSLVVDPKTVPSTLEVTATSETGEIMGLSHRTRPLFGIQFHPESFITQEGEKLAENFLKTVSGT